MTKINQVWYTRQDKVSSLNFKLIKEQIEKDQERAEKVDKMMTQIVL